MIDLPPLAAEKLQALRAADPTHQVLRLYVAGQSCCKVSYGLAFDVSADPGDTVMERAGIPVAVDPLSLPVVDGSTIDFVDAVAGGGFVVRNPNAGGGCACGR